MACPLQHAAPVCDIVLQVVIDRPSSGCAGAVLAAEEGTMVRVLWSAPAFDALAAILLFHADCVNQLHICPAACARSPFRTEAIGGCKK